MIDTIYKGIGRTIDTTVAELLPKLQLLTLEGQEEDGNLIWSGHQDDISEADYRTFFAQEHGHFPSDSEDYDQVAQER